MNDLSATAWDQIPSEEVFPGIARQVIHGERQSMVRYLYAPGSVFPIHDHPEEQITVVVSGRIRFNVAGRELELGPGEVAVIPPHVPHGAEVVGDQAVETYNALSPRRSTAPFSHRGEE